MVEQSATVDDELGEKPARGLLASEQQRSHPLAGALCVGIAFLLGTTVRQCELRDPALMPQSGGGGDGTAYGWRAGALAYAAYPDGGWAQKLLYFAWHAPQLVYHCHVTHWVCIIPLSMLTAATVISIGRCFNLQFVRTSTPVLLAWCFGNVLYPLLFAFVPGATRAGVACSDYHRSGIWTFIDCSSAAYHAQFLTAATSGVGAIKIGVYAMGLCLGPLWQRLMASLSLVMGCRLVIAVLLARYGMADAFSWPTQAPAPITWRSMVQALGRMPLELQGALFALVVPTLVYFAGNMLAPLRQLPARATAQRAARISEPVGDVFMGGSGASTSSTAPAGPSFADDLTLEKLRAQQDYAASASAAAVKVGSSQAAAAPASPSEAASLASGHAEALDGSTSSTNLSGELLGEQEERGVAELEQQEPAKPPPQQQQPAPQEPALSVSISAGAKLMLGDLYAGISMLQPAAAATHDAMRKAAADHVAALLGEDAAMSATRSTGVVEFPHGKYVPYKGMCRMTPVGIKVNTPGHDSFDAISSLVTSTLHSTATLQLAGGSHGLAPPLISSACVPGCVHLLGSVIYSAVDDNGGHGAAGGPDGDGGAGGLAASLADSVVPPLTSLLAKQGQAMPAVKITAGNQTVEIAASNAAPAPPAPATVQLAACQPAYLVAGQASTVKLMVTRDQDTAPVPARLVMFDVAGNILLDQDAGELGGGDSVVAVTAPPCDACNVAQIALLLDGVRLGCVQPLPVLPKPAAADVQRLWAVAVAETVRADLEAGDSDIAPAGADGAPALLAALQPRHVAAAWQQHMAPLLVDMCYVLGSRRPLAVDSTALPILHGVLHYLAASGAVDLLAHIQHCEQRKQAAPTAPVAGKASTTCAPRARFNDAAAAGKAAATCAPTARSVFAPVAVKAPNGLVEVTEACSAAAPEPQASTSRSGALPKELETCKAEPGVGDMAPACRAAERRSMVQCLMRGGFSSVEEEARYRDYVARATPAADLFAAGYHLLVAVASLTAYQYTTGQSMPQQYTGKLLIVVAHVLPSLYMILYRFKMDTGAKRDQMLVAWDCILTVVVCVAAFWPYAQMPPNVVASLSVPSLVHDVAHVFSGVLHPLIRQVPLRHHQLMALVGTVAFCYVSLRLGLPPHRVAARYGINWIISTSVAAACDAGMRSMFLASSQGQGMIAGKAKMV